MHRSWSRELSRSEREVLGLYVPGGVQGRVLQDRQLHVLQALEGRQGQEQDDEEAREEGAGVEVKIKKTPAPVTDGKHVPPDKITFTQEEVGAITSGIEYGRQVNRSSVMVNRLRAFADTPVRAPLDQFWTFLPVICHDCLRELPLSNLTMGLDFFIRCLDNEECRSVRYPPKTESPSVAETKVRKVKVKGSK